MVVCDGLLWWICTCSGFAVSNFFFCFFSFYVASNTVKYFQTIFQNVNKYWKNNHFFKNYLHLQIFYGREYFTSKQTKPKFMFHFHQSNEMNTNHDLSAGLIND